jgi:DNA-directed RNA polymerase subunit RPC12/RpoP
LVAAQTQDSRQNISKNSLRIVSGYKHYWRFVAPVVEVKMPSKEEQALVYRVCPECGQGFTGLYADRLCPRCRHKFLEKDKMLQLRGGIIKDYFMG